jgi:hypothetical protein
VKLIEGKRLIGVELRLNQIRAPVLKYLGRYEFARVLLSAALRRGPQGVKE